MKLFVMSDIHSFFEEMAEALEKNGFEMDNPDHCVVVCGDLFDRGHDAKKMFDFAKWLAERDRLVYIYGNHEELLFDCIDEVLAGRGVSSHHISNGTFDTICQITEMGKYDLGYGLFDREVFKERIKELTDFIYENAVDYAEAGEYIFVHGWIPCDPINGKVDENWDDEDANWHGARWINGMSAWARGARLEGKTIVCGHFHASWGHSHLHLDRKEFPQKGVKGWQESFRPFYDEGIIAIDACTPYSGYVNCVVLEV